MILVGTTMAAWKYEGREGAAHAWLLNGEEMIESDKDVAFFAAFEVDARGIAPFQPTIDRLLELHAAGAHHVQWWTFSIDDHVDEIDSNTRLVRICEGRNLITDYAMRHRASEILFLDSDTRVQGDCIPKLREVGWPIVGGRVGNYCQHGEVVTHHPEHGYPFPFPVQRHWNTAGFLWVSRFLFRRLRWRYDLEAQMTDDPCYDLDAGALGYPTLVRHDVNGEHLDYLVPVEKRPGDRTYHR